MSNRRHIWTLPLIILAALPTLGLNYGAYSEHPGITIAFVLTILMFFCIFPLMTIKGSIVYGAAAHAQLPLVAFTCLLVVLILRRKRVSSPVIVLCAVAVYVAGIVTTNLLSPLFRMEAR